MESRYSGNAQLTSLFLSFRETVESWKKRKNIVATQGRFNRYTKEMVIHGLDTLDRVHQLIIRKEKREGDLVL